MAFSGHIARKRFGQHWLKDDFVLEKIIEAADLKGNDRVLEVGPGRGALTERLLASQALAIHAIELDRDLVKGLRKRFQSQSRFTLQVGDALSISLTPPDGIASNKVVANIPYNITGPLIERLIGGLGAQRDYRFDLLVLLLQKEVADRILAKGGDANFSAMTVRLQLLAKCSEVCLVAPSAFSPQPRVYSKVVLIKPFHSHKVLSPELADALDILLGKAFNARRKMLKNTLGALLPSIELEYLANRAGINLNQRPQEISPNLWLSLAKSFIQLKGSCKKNG